MIPCEAPLYWPAHRPIPEFRMSRRCFALIPAAGVGSRAGTGSPKQYAALDGLPMLVHTLRAFVDCARIAAVRVVLAPDDRWPATAPAAALVAQAGARLRFDPVGGASRAESVANGLACLADEADGDDWVLVHDAARPCITQALVTAMIDALIDDPVGGLLALPVADTVKRAGADGRVAATIPRDGLWVAQTPQMFRLARLREAYDACGAVTDDAGAIEALGLAPRLVNGDTRNLKVTYPADFAIAERHLRRTRREVRE
jgi:2-C-methyl-D-erythritol 4-phosphate cytidylyltransferase